MLTPCSGTSVVIQPNVFPLGDGISTASCGSSVFRVTSTRVTPLASVAVPLNSTLSPVTVARFAGDSSTSTGAAVSEAVNVTVHADTRPTWAPPVTASSLRRRVSPPLAISAVSLSSTLNVFGPISSSAQFKVTGLAGRLKSSRPLAVPPMGVTWTLTAPFPPSSRFTVMGTRVLPVAAFTAA